MSTPPAWADALLRLVLKSADVDSVSGDLLEEYREAVLPGRGSQAADAWYVRQVLGFVWRGARGWAILFASAYLVRQVFDWLAPPADYAVRSTASTFIGIGILLAAGIWASWRSRSPLAGTVAGVALTGIAAVFSAAGALVLLAIWHDPATLAATDASGGLGELFELPFLMMIPGVVLGTVGGLIGGRLRRLQAV